LISLDRLSRGVYDGNGLSAFRGTRLAVQAICYFIRVACRLGERHAICGLALQRSIGQFLDARSRRIDWYPAR
jgi:hypothetical protein